MILGLNVEAAQYTKHQKQPGGLVGKKQARLTARLSSSGSSPCREYTNGRGSKGLYISEPSLVSEQY